ncbi:MAG: MBL fold metallo-hydrolase [Clostridiales bacterium]|nr:MBL fold metallo-hydrolase [Clostridiales bacterium]MBQ3322446.1 flavin reductase [Bacillota bacterium]
MNRKITDTIIYIGANDHDIDLFEGQYIVPNGMAYNSYAVIGDKIAIMDTIDQSKTDEWLQNIEAAIKCDAPDYLVVQHMEPDHSASIQAFVEKFPNATVVGNKKTFKMIGQFFPELEMKNTLEVENGDKLDLGGHELNFVFAPMVHWPEVMMTYDPAEKILFSADGFGKFGALDVEEDWACEARRYYFGIVGKYGPQVQTVLKKAAALDIEKILPLHGPMLEEDLGYYIGLYDTWSSYLAESDGIFIAYTSVYGHTKAAAELLRDELVALGVPTVEITDLARDDWAEAVEDAFRYDKLVLATTTYNSEIFPFMRQFIDHLTERNFQKKTVAFIENGSWAPTAAKVMRGMFEKSKDITFAKNTVSILSAMNEENKEQIKALAAELAADYIKPDVEEEEKKIDPSALFKIGYGLYVITSNDGKKDNGFIGNTVAQVSNDPSRIIVGVNKANYSCETINKTGVLNVCTLNEQAPFQIFQHFGFQSGRDVDKFADFEHYDQSSNGLPYLNKYANGYMSLKVFDTVDTGSHLMFFCDITESAVLNDVDTMTYTFYQKNVKPRPQEEVKGWVCDVCGYVFEGEDLPEDFICPLCKHGASDFSKMG